MAVLVSTKIKGQTREGYDGILSTVKEVVEKAPGFIMHCAYPAEGEWVGYEIWESKIQADQFFAKYIAPNIPKGVHPKRSYQELHSLLMPVE